MGKTKIEWATHVWNPVVGCSIVSPGCTNCYAMAQAAHIQRLTKGNTHYAGTTREVNGHTVWTGKLQQAPDHIWTMPLTWKKPRRIFVNSMGDLFHESVPDAWIDRAFVVMALSPQHTFQILTKRAKRMREWVSEKWEANWGPIHDICERQGIESPGISETWPLPNVWLGVSAEDQARADERIPDLLSTPAAIRFVSAEPLLGPIDFKPREYSEQCIRCGEGPDAPHNHPDGYRNRGLDWIIVGGESGPQARPMHPGWARSIRDQCAAAGVPFFFKQWGEWSATLGHFTGNIDFDPERQEQPLRATQSQVLLAHEIRPGRTLLERGGKKRAGRLLDGRTHDAMPEVK